MTLSSLFRPALVGLTVLLVLVAPATAQTDPVEQATLKGLTEVTISIGPLNADDTRCGVSEGQLNAAATKALLDNGIRISDDTGPLAPILHVSANTLHFDSKNQCMTYLDVELFQALFATPAHSLTEVFGVFILARRGVMTAAPPSAHGQRIRDSVFEFVEQIALAIRVANQ